MGRWIYFELTAPYSHVMKCWAGKQPSSLQFVFKMDMLYIFTFMYTWWCTNTQSCKNTKHEEYTSLMNCIDECKIFDICFRNLLLNVCIIDIKYSLQYHCWRVPGRDSYTVNMNLASMSGLVFLFWNFTDTLVQRKHH